MFSVVKVIVLQCFISEYFFCFEFVFWGRIEFSIDKRMIGMKKVGLFVKKIVYLHIY